MFRMLNFLVLFAAFSGQAVADEGAPKADVPKAKMGSVGFVTQDLDATVGFYTNILGFSVVGTADVTSPKTRQVIGVQTSEPVRYAALAPAAWVGGNSSLAIISFFEVLSAEERTTSHDPHRASIVAEPVLGLSVDDVERVAVRAAAVGVPVIASLGDSGTSRTTRSIALLDPNGLRLEIYEY